MNRYPITPLPLPFQDLQPSPYIGTCQRAEGQARGQPNAEGLHSQAGLLDDLGVMPAYSYHQGLKKWCGLETSLDDGPWEGKSVIVYAGVTVPPSLCLFPKAFD